MGDLRLRKLHGGSDWAKLISSCHIFTSYIDSGLQASLINTLNPSTSSEPITPAQTALIKLVDSHLSAAHPDNADNAFLLPLFDRLQIYATGSLGSGIDDARLPKVLEALVLVLESLGSIGLAYQARLDEGQTGGEEEKIMRAMQAEGGIVGPIISMSTLSNATHPRSLERIE
jgi:hypothetical protein